MSTIQKLIEQVKIAASAELAFCNEIDTPYVCNLISTPAGKEKMINLIIEYVGKNSMSIGEAINFIERENNPQLSN